MRGGKMADRKINGNGNERSHRFFIVDVFGEEKYAGNQLAVVVPEGKTALGPGPPRKTVSGSDPVYAGDTRQGIRRTDCFR
jgi:hypothetical protein